MALFSFPMPLFSPPAPSTTAAKAVQEASQETKYTSLIDEEEQPAKKTCASAAKKTTKTKKEKKTSADHDAEDKAAKAVAKKNMTLTSKILNKSGAGVAPLPRLTSTGIQIPSTTPCIISDCARHPDPDSGDNEDLQIDTNSKDDLNSGDEEELAAVKDKGKGKARDLHNLGAESDKDLDADADVGDKENDNKDVDEEAAGAAEGEVAGVGDGSDDDEGDVTIMDVDVNITPRKPAKHDASQSPLTDKHTGKAQCCNVSHSSAASSAASLPAPSHSPSPSDNLQELQGALRTTGGFTPNMADFVPVDDVLPIETHGKGKVVMHTTLGMTDKPHSVTMAHFPTLASILKILTRKFLTVTESAISVLDVDGKWEVAGPFALVLEDDMDVTWNNDFKLFMLLKPLPAASTLAFPTFPPSLISTRFGSSVAHSGSSIVPSSIAPSASISSVGVATAGALPPAPDYICAAYSTKQHLILYTILLEVPVSLVPNTKPNDGDIILAYEHWKAASTAQERLKAKYDAHDPKFPPLPPFPNIENTHAIYMNPSSFSNYNPLFLAAIEHPDILTYLEGDAGVGLAIYKKLWGAVKPGKATLGQLTKQINTEQKKEEKRSAKKKAGPSKSNFCLQTYMMLLVVWFLLGLVPCVAEAPKQDPFPNMLFTEFAQSIQDNFGPKIKLSTVLMLLMTLVSNTDLLNLHGQQQASQQQESTSWMAALVCTVKAKLSDSGFISLFTTDDLRTSRSEQQQITLAGKKLSQFSRSLSLASHSSIGNFKSKLRPISMTSIQPIILITPIVMACPTLDCNNHSLTQDLQEHDISHVTLLKGSQCLEKVPILAGRCSSCNSLYWADHEQFTQNNGDDLCLYLNNAKYLKVGKSVWVDHTVSEAIVNANYSFHASTAVITEFWNFSFVKPNGGTFKLGRRQVWKAFVEESIQQMGKFNKHQIVFEDNLSINALVAAAYIELGDNGVIHSAEGHSCDECCHAFKDVADVIPRQPNDPAAVVGYDENHAVPDYAGEPVDPNAMEVDNQPAAVVQPTGPVTLGVFCKKHAERIKNKCHMKGCGKVKVGDTKACQDHQEQWAIFHRRYANTLLLGVQWILRRAQEERQEWLPHAAKTEELEHDNLEEQEVEETICAPCGVVFAWRKFAKSEGVAKILQFLENVYPDPVSHPSYIAIDKGCALLKHIVRQGHWPAWEPTTRIIVDSYHYINHQVTDHLCWTWCNPAPLNGDAPNLVVVANDKQDNPYYKRAFNTQSVILV
ncbi:hypothetical protein BDN71DRAFT_1498064 [Pleurotus eryngii]|uniref:CxC5 like cysteine cluster associated with KDZ domain-containing protein n=1 Tax=Pleurotus eryngii TaxID=5323 RepID=A0A9P6DD31_PLEER|nr:hypothetical protein BDN71DRAFT_1498064 [Pleurotus eryngii]